MHRLFFLTFQPWIFWVVTQTPWQPLPPVGPPPTEAPRDALIDDFQPFEREAPRQPVRERAAESARAVEQILELRQRVGSSISGTVLENVPGRPSADQEFVQILRQLARADATQPTTERPHALFVDNPYAVPPALDLPPGLDGELVQSLRRNSRLLEQKANDFEDQRDYRRADALRDLAGQVRQLARELHPPEDRDLPRYR